MKYIRTYESVTEKNIVNSYMPTVVKEMYQEIFDDFNVKENILKIYLSDNPNFPGATIVDKDGKKYVFISGTGFNRFANCYLINLILDTALMPKIEEILNQKREVYGINYIIAIARSVHPETGLVVDKIGGILLLEEI